MKDRLFVLILSFNLALLGATACSGAALPAAQLTSWFSAAQPSDRASAAEDEAERSRRAAQVLSEILEAPDHQIPEELLEKARAIAVIPHVVKGAFIFGGSFGKGLISARKPNGSWSLPAFIDLSAGSFGLQIGASATDYVLIFTNHQGLDPLLKGKVKLGGDASIAAGPVGRTASADTDITLKAAIYSYSRSKGLFAGLSLSGAVVSIDDSADHKVYGPGVTGTDLLIRHKGSMSAAVRPFVTALRRHVPPIHR